jgi:hypothetical protein
MVAENGIKPHSDTHAALMNHETTVAASAPQSCCRSNPAANETAGLSYDTKFDLKQAIDLPYTAEWFSVPPAAPHGQIPRLGTLHPSLVPAVQAAYRAVTE